FHGVAERLWADTGYGPSDVDAAQIYENMTGMGVAALIEHGFCTPDSAGEFVRFDNLVAPGGVLPINTSGGNPARGVTHRMGPGSAGGLRGTSSTRVPHAALSLMTGGPGAAMVSTALLGTAETV